MPSDRDTSAASERSRREFLACAGGLMLGAAGVGLVAAGCGAQNPARRLVSAPAADWQGPEVAGASMTHGAGRRVVEVTSGTDGAEARLTLQRTAPVTLRNRVLAFSLKLDARTADDVAYVVVKVGSGTVPFENVAYQEILNTGGTAAVAQASYLLSVIKPGEWTRMTIGPPSLVGRLDTNIDPVDFDQLQDFEVAVAGNIGSRVRFSFGGMEVLEGDSRFPRGVVSLTFDDGLASPFRLALPVLERHGFGATAFVIRDLIESAGANGSYMSVSQLHELQARRWEIAAHANLLADHNAHFGFVSVPRHRLISDVTDEAAWLRASGFNGVADIALPQGWFNDEVQDVLVHSGRFQTIRTVDYRTVETLPVANPYRLRARLYDHTQAIGPAGLPGSIMWRVDQVARYGGWLILGFHDIVGPRGPLVAPVINEGSAVRDTDFAEIADHISRRSVPVRTIREVWDAHPGQFGG